MDFFCCINHFCDTLLCKCGDKDDREIIVHTKILFNRKDILTCGICFLLDQIPFVHDDDRCPVALHSRIDNLQILFINSLRGIKKNHGNIASFNGMERPDCAVEFDAF